MHTPLPFRFMPLLGALAFGLAAPMALAQSPSAGHAAHQHTHAHPNAPAVTPVDAPVDTKPNSTEGEVRRIDLARQNITLRHQAIIDLNMPPMTMVFRVRDPSLLDAVAVGDKVRFVATQQGGEYWVTDLKRSP